jgi:hypothetical protein
LEEAMTNKFVSFLKKAGQVIASAAMIAEEFYPALAPLVNAVLPAKDQAKAASVEATVSSDISSVSSVVMSVEGISATLTQPLSGAQKAAAAGPQIGAIFLASEALAGKKIANPAAFNAAMAVIAGGVADAWNAVDGSALPTPAAATPAPAAT